MAALTTMEDECGSENLGKKEHWDYLYSNELNCFRENGTMGYIWYGDDCTNRIIRWVNTKAFINQNDKILDIGCGNGLLLRELALQGFKNLTGVDYSEIAIDLAKSIAESNQMPITFLNIDILNLSTHNVLYENYALCIDKGTFDTISLYSEIASDNRKIYVQNINSLLQNNGYLLIVSCNWTKDELLSFFSCFVLVDEILSSSFQFGGKTGNSYTTLIFKKTNL